MVNCECEEFFVLKSNIKNEKSLSEMTNLGMNFQL